MFPLVLLVSLAAAPEHLCGFEDAAASTPIVAYGTWPRLGTAYGVPVFVEPSLRGTLKERNAKGRLPLVSDQLGFVEWFFGLGRVPLRAIVITDASERNAFSHVAEQVIEFRGSLFVDGDEPAVSSQAIMTVLLHEATHLFDAARKVSDQAPFLTAFASLTCADAQALAERHYHDSQFGHPWSDPSELLASVVATLPHLDWDERVMRFSPQERTAYLSVLAALVDALVVSEIPERSPILQTARRRLRSFTTQDALVYARPSR